jgi:myo-inositol 2-dehydrogenase/D-chiro-inositol 1-dehydrogenase
MKVGLVGAGSIAALHAQAYSQIGIQIAAVADINRQAFDSKRNLFGGARFYETPQQLADDPDVDAIDICVTNRFHVEMLRMAARTGKHIFCEKTLTDSEHNSAAILQELSDYGANIQVGYMKRFFPATVKAVDLMAEIGRPISAYVRSYQGYERDDDPYNDPGWRPSATGPSHTLSFAGAGMLNMAGSHMLDLICMLLGDVNDVYCKNWKPESYDAETNSHGLLQMRSECIVHFEAALSPYSRNGKWADGWDERFEIIGSQGSLELLFPVWNLPGENPALLRHYDQRTKTMREYSFPKVNPFAQELKHFVAQCEQGKKSVPGPAEGYYVDKLIDAFYRSSATGLPVSM